jgi:prepilin-type N-terminal cleavage/methylation domain-containing protein
MRLLCDNPARRRALAVGFTLIEMLTTVAIIAIFALTAGQIVSQASRLVTTSEANMRQNAQAFAISRRLRSDLMQCSRQGFLVLEQAADGTPRLYATSPGISWTLSGTAKSTSQLIGLGICGTDTGNGERQLYRCGWVASDKSNANADPAVSDPKADPDRFRDNLDANAWKWRDFADFQMWDAAKIGLCVDFFNSRWTPSQLGVPANTIQDVKSAWQLLSSRCKSLEIAWTKGEKNGSDLVWYTQTTRKIWNNDNWGEWPTAIRIRYTLADALVPGNIRQYEVICPVGQ